MILKKSPVTNLKRQIGMLGEKAAARYLNETDTRGQKRKSVIDTLSAQIILQNALDRLKNMVNQ